ncbi:MAG: hypothetical protein ABIP97_14080 [Chthoniobacterales bacterium]
MLRLTRKEQVVVVFLLLTFLLGLGVKHYRQIHTQQLAEQSINT